MLPKLADIGHDFESLIVGVVNKDHTIVGVVTQFVGVVNKVHTICSVKTYFLDSFFNIIISFLNFFAKESYYMIVASFPGSPCLGTRLI